jgi:hypothetical protein
VLNSVLIKKKVKQSNHRFEQALRVPGVWGFQISRQSAHESGRVVNPKHRPPLPPRKDSWYSFLLDAESTPRTTVRTEGLCQWKIRITRSGIWTRDLPICSAVPQLTATQHLSLHNDVTGFKNLFLHYGESLDFCSRVTDTQLLQHMPQIT